MHDDLLTFLSKIGDLKVISRTSVNKYRDSKKSSPEIAKELGVSNLLEGSVRRIGNQLRINVQLIDARNDEHIWSEIYDRELSTTNILQIQSEIAREITSVLNATIAKGQLGLNLSLPTKNIRAYEAYLKAKQLSDIRNNKSLLQAKNLLQFAINEDSSFAEAYIHLGDVHLMLIEYSELNEKDNFEIAQNYLDKGLNLDPNLAEGYALKGLLHHQRDKNFELSKKAFEKAILLNPNYGYAHHWYANILNSYKRDFAGALKHRKIALSLNPLSPPLIQEYAWSLSIMGNYQESIQVFKHGISIEPNYPAWYRGGLSGVYRCFLGRLDSAAIYGYISRNQPEHDISNFSLNHNYIRGIAELDMAHELEMVLEELERKTPVDSSIYNSYLTEIAFINSDYDKLIQLSENKKENKSNSPLDYRYGQLKKFSALFFKRDFIAAAENYENFYLANNSKLINSRNDMIGMNTFLDYIYCLQQIGKDSLLDQLYNANQDILLYSPIADEGSIHLRKFREWVKIRDAVMKGQEERAVQMLRDYFSSGYLAEWQYVEKSPFLDSLRKHPEFQKLIEELKSNIRQQQRNYKNFLNEQTIG
jgi:TolB-like protein/Tfp pilus assembly protein PilF